MTTSTTTTTIIPINSCRKRVWRFTIITPNDDCLSRLSNLPCSYIMYEHVNDEDHDIQLIHGFIYFNNAISYRKCCKVIPEGEIEFASGTYIQNRNYCSPTIYSVFIERGRLPGSRKKKINLRE